tara:strand:- start:218 stop:397 length:180 start_codon:yes stop_codon:yes gene_type:complete
MIRISWFFRLVTLLAFGFGLYLAVMMLFIFAMDQSQVCHDYLYPTDKYCHLTSQMFGFH